MTGTAAAERAAGDAPRTRRAGATSRGAARAPAPPGLGFAWAAAVFGLALVLRVAHAFEIRTAAFFTYPINDSRSYDAWARQIAAGDWIGGEAFYQAPLYPYVLAVVYRLLGTDPLVLRCFQALIGAAACLLLAQATARLTSSRVGLAAGFLFAAYAPALFYDGMIGKSVLDAFLLCLALWCVSRAAPGRGAWPWLFPGAALGALALTRENALVFPAALVVWLLLPFGHARPGGRPRTAGRRLAAVAWLCLGVVVVLLPVAVRNQVVAGEFHLTTSQFGPNFYIGNNPTATGRYRALRLGRSDARYERLDATALAEAASDRALAPGEVSAYWSGRAFDYITGDPLDWLALKATILGYLFESTEWVDSEDLYTHAEQSRVLRASALVLHFGIVAPLAALGLVATVVSSQRRRRLAPLLWMAAAYAATVVAFYVFGRYRYPLAPFAILFAAVGLTSLPVLLTRRRGVLAAGLSCAALVAVVSFLQDTRREHQQAVTAHNVAVALEQAGRLDEAETWYRRAVAFEPEAYLAANRLGELLQRQGRHREAIPHFEEAARLWTKSALPYTNLGVSLEASGRLEAAGGALLRAAEREPGNPAPHVRLGALLRRMGHYDQALASFERARTLAADHPGALAGAAWILAAHPDPKQRDPARAVAFAAEAVAQGGRQPALLDALAAATAAAGDTEQAARIAREALALAEKRGGRARVAPMRSRLRLYAAGEIYVDERPDLPTAAVGEP